MKDSHYLTGKISAMPPGTENFIREEVKSGRKTVSGGGKSVSGRKGPNPETDAKYREALSLYTSTEMTCREICNVCGVTPSGLQAYLRRYHREKMLARYNVQCGKDDVYGIKLCRSVGQTPAAYIKYRDAIAACDDIRFIGYNISEIARQFNLNGAALGNQLRRHYPEILHRREQERMLRGIDDHQQRGVRPWCKEQYSSSVEMLCSTDKTLPEVARECNVSESGLSGHVLFYHQDLLKKRRKTRKEAEAKRQKGKITGNGRLHTPSPESEQRYREAVKLYKDTTMTLKEIASATGVSAEGLRSYLHSWHLDLVFQRRGVEYREGDSTRLSDTKAYQKSAAAKYAAAIERLKTSGLSTAAVAAEFGLHPDCFREYLKEHEPELCAQQGMVIGPNGKPVLARSMKRYGEAIRLYETTSEDLKSIAVRLGIPYNSLGGFVRRNFPELIEKHNSMLCHSSRPCHPSASCHSD